MSEWSYSGDPSLSTLDEVRFHLGDIDAGNPLLSDAEINYWIGIKYPEYGSAIMVAAFCADSVASRTATEVSQSGDGVSIGADQLQDKFTQLAASLRDQYNRDAGAYATPYVGSNDTQRSEPGERPGWASIGQHDNPEAGRQNTDQDYYARRDDWTFGW